MPDLIKTSRDINLQNPVVFTGPGGEMVDLGNRIMGTPVRTETIRTRKKIRLEDRLENSLQCGLDNPVRDSGDGGFILRSFQRFTGF
jgi:hypothetical protein